MTLSIRAKLTLNTVIAVTVGLTLAGWLVLRSIEQLELERVTDGLEVRAALARISLARLLEQPDQGGSRVTLQAMVHELSRQSDTRVTVIDLDGQVLADSARPSGTIDPLENHSNSPEVIQAQREGRGTDIRRSGTTGERLLYLALPVRTRETGPAGFVRLALPLTTLDAHAVDLHKSLGLALGVAFLCSIVLSLFLIKGFTRPLSEMVTFARKLADGTLAQRIRTAQHDEVGVLASTLNQMADRLETTIREVSEDRAQLRAMLTAMVEGVMVLDAKGKVLQINPALERMLLAPGVEARGRMHWEVIRHHELNELANEVLSSQRNQSAEITVAPTGRVFTVQASVAGGRQENEACAVLVFHDLTALRRLEKVRKDFVANVSHELRTPLTSIQGYAQALKDGAVGTAAQALAFLDIILKQSERLNLILEDLLQLSHIESGEVVFKHEPVPLLPLVERSIAVMKPQAEKKGHSIAVSIPDDMPPVVGDEDRLVQILTNLLDNAVKYTPVQGNISVTACLPKETEGGTVELTVTDTGIGIPEPDRPRVFERFYRVDKARSRELGGTGLGLSIVKHIVEGHGGKVWVEGNHPSGSRFVIRLPAAVHQPFISSPAESGSPT